MNSISSKRYSMSCMIRVKSCIVALSMSCFFLASFSARSENYETNTAVLLNQQLQQLTDQAQSLSSILSVLNDNLGASGGTYDIGGDVQQMRLFVNPSNPYQSQSLPNYLRWLLYETSGRSSLPVSTTPSGDSLFSYARDIKNNTANISQTNNKLDTSNSRLASILSTLRGISNSVASSSSSSSTVISNLNEITVIVTNIGSGSSGVISPDILAGNPFWLTNTTFAVNWDDWSRIQPMPRLRYPSLSFVELLSVMMAQRTVGLDSSIHSFNDYYSAFGADLNNSAINWKGTGLTWYDWVADAFKSNFVADATYSQRLLDQLRSLSNALSSASASVYVTNQNNVFLTNVVSLSAEDILAANPWWSTNSGFAGLWSQFDYPNLPFPAPDTFLTFPYLFSVFAASRFRSSGIHESTPSSLSDLQLSWGFHGDNVANNVYSFEDWIADFFMSNRVLQTAASTNQLVEELRSYGYETEVSDSITNTPLPEYSLPRSETISEAEDALDSGEQAITDLIDSLPKPGTGGNPEIVLIPEFTVGGIHVREYRASLNSSIVPVCRSVLSFLYGVALACYVFSLAKSEYVYYATLGRHWGKY